MTTQSNFLIRASLIESALIKTKLNAAELRNVFFKVSLEMGFKVVGFSISQHLGKLTIDGESVITNTSREGVVLVSSGNQLRKAALAFFKSQSFKNVGSASYPLYEDAYGNKIKIWKAVGKNWLSFEKR